MPRTLRLGDGSYMRRLDVQHLLQFLHGMQCVQVVGYSNVGKSALMRLLAQPDVWTQELGEAGHEFLAVYVDCNRMLDMSDQGFYELVLRCLQESSPLLAEEPELAAAYEMLVAPASEFQIPLGFNRGVTAVLEALSNKVVFLFDEFDEPFSQIDSRVFLNLRALRDRHNAQLAYVTATCQPLTDIQLGAHNAEFCELFSQRTWILAPLTRSDVERSVQRYTEAYETNFTQADFAFIYQWAGGHPAMVEGICRLLHRAVEAEMEAGGSPNGEEQSLSITERQERHQRLARQLAGDTHLKQECLKLWQHCTEAEQEELKALCWPPHHPIQPSVLNGLERRHLVRRSEGRHQIFCRLLHEYIRRISITPPDASTQLWVDVESGDVLVDGKPVELLTSLEYRLMLLLFYNAEKIVDRYQIVTEVWGEEYLDEVEDARIEKLISRLRQKVEPDPSNPRFLTTVRGRGYRLVLGEAEPAS